MAVNSDIETATRGVTLQATKVGEVLGHDLSQAGLSAAAGEIRKLGEELRRVRQLVRRDLTVPIKPTTLDTLRSMVYSLSDAITDGLLDPTTPVGELVNPASGFGIDAPFSAFDAVGDEAASIADEISVIRPVAEHYFHREVARLRKERTTDVAAVEAMTLTGPQQDVKDRIIGFIDRIADELNGSISAFERQEP